MEPLRFRRRSSLRRPSVDSQRLQFNGSASFDATVSGSPGPGSAFEANAISFFGMFFNVDTTANAVLVYDAVVNGFSLANSIDVEVRRESDAEILFSDTLRSDPQSGAAHHAFTMPLRLLPGQYGVSIDVRAINLIPSDFAANSAVAALSISVVPEPQTWLLLAAGLGLLPLTLRSRRRVRRTGGCGFRDAACARSGRRLQTLAGERRGMRVCRATRSRTAAWPRSSAPCRGPRRSRW